MGTFERYLTVWVLICIAIGIGLGYVAGDQIKFISSIELNTVNIPVAILVWLMIYPMMVQIDFSSLKKVTNNAKGIGLTVIVNWLIKPFTMAFFAWLFFYNIYEAWLSPDHAAEYLAGAILLGAAPCTAMVFVWSYLTKGDANYTLVQVSVNNIILIVAFIPIVAGLFSLFDIVVENNERIGIPYHTLITSVLIFIVIPLVAGFLTHKTLIAKKRQKVV